MSISLIRKNCDLVDNPGRGFCLSFATELGIVRLGIVDELRNQKEDAIKVGCTAYRTRISLRGTPKDHCKKCIEAMKHVMRTADREVLSQRSCKVIDYWKDHPEVLDFISKFILLLIYSHPPDFPHY